MMICMVAHVADFDIAKLLGFGDSMTRTMTLATVGYMAPGDLFASLMSFNFIILKNRTSNFLWYINIADYGMDGIVSTQGVLKE